MKIKEINLQHYGPLPKFNKEFDEGVHIIYGSNESGKTLLIDAVMKMLIGGKKFDSSLGRVEEFPSGYVLIEKDGEEFKLDSKESLEDIMEIGSDELRNIFCIRDADLRITKETEFYERTQDKIAGLRSSDIRRIISSLRGRGRLTAGGGLSDSAGNDKARSVYSEASSLVTEISTYNKRAKEENVEKIELDLMEARASQVSSRDKMNKLEKAKQKLEFEAIQSDYNELTTANSEFKPIPTKELGKLQGYIDDYEANPVNDKEIQRNLGLYKMLSVAALGVGFIAFILVYVLSMPTLGYLVPVFFIIGGAYSVYQWSMNNAILSESERLQSLILSYGSQLGISSGTVSGIQAELTDIIQENDAIRRRLYEKQGIVKSYFDIRTEVTDEILSQASQLLGELEKKVDFEVTETYSEEEYNSLKVDIDSAQARIDELNGQLADHRAKLGDFNSRIAGLGYSRFMDSDIELLIDNLEALERVVPILAELRDKINLDKETALMAIKTFEQLETEEEAKITELFSKDSSAVEIFKDSTNGRYTDLRYDINSKTIIVERPTGETLEVSKLSKGTRDQLYLAIRVALGEKLLEGSQGFFIMDEAFLSSDESRLRSQVKMLEKLSKKGWQIIYFTMKNDALETISKITDNEVLTLTQLA